MAQATPTRERIPRRTTAIPITMTGEPINQHKDVTMTTSSTTAAKPSPQKPGDSVCNSYLQSYQEFSQEVSKSAGNLSQHLKHSKKGRIMDTLAALDKCTPTKESPGMKRWWTICQVSSFLCTVDIAFLVFLCVNRYEEETCSPHFLFHFLYLKFTGRTFSPSLNTLWSVWNSHRFQTTHCLCRRHAARQQSSR